MGKDPAVLFYTADFLAGTVFMRNEQVGKYIKLLCMQHQQGHLREEDMLEMCGTYDERIFSKFVKDENGLYYNERMEEETLKRKRYSESRSANRKSAKSKDMTKDVKNTSKTYVSHMENEIENENINVIKSIIEYLNHKLGARYKYTTKTYQTCIKARIKEGFTYDDFVCVIDKKYTEWKDTEFESYLRPETLFGTKFQSYLNAKQINAKSKTEKARYGNFDEHDAFARALERTYGDEDLAGDI